VYMPSVGKYYRPIFELVDWNTARTRCSDLLSGSRLIDINNGRESAAVQNLIASFDGNFTCYLLIFNNILVFAKYRRKLIS